MIWVRLWLFWVAGIVVVIGDVIDTVIASGRRRRHQAGGGVISGVAIESSVARCLALVGRCIGRFTMVNVPHNCTNYLNFLASQPHLDLTRFLESVSLHAGRGTSSATTHRTPSLPW